MQSQKSNTGLQYEISVEKPALWFSSSHFLIGYDKCEHLHGHNYKVKISCRGELKGDMLVNFSDLRAFGQEIIAQLDHKILLPGKSHEIKIDERDHTLNVSAGNKSYSFPKKDVLILPISATTSENLANHIYHQIKKKIQEFEVLVSIEETPGNIASFGDFL